ncbi:hypothetical protein RO787_21065 [Blautia coccoides]|uniref:hypothetical protein n=1 Tax=Blautia producta TaxID=33035 RepID=UPI0028A3881E|nr:hypothetical protein [Blautia coccoides]MDT4375824.1 hypothetical protein [Blautia coccoides]
MTYFTDSPFEKMMMQKPRGRRGNPPSPHKEKQEKARGKNEHYRELIITPKERSDKK